jgi:hypothetical protein
MPRKIGFIVLLMFFSTQFAPAESSKQFSGHVYDTQSKSGIANLEVKMTPRSASNAPVLIGTTDAGGTFLFKNAQVGTYLLDVLQGPYLLYRNEVDLSKIDSVEIPVDRR